MNKYIDENPIRWGVLATGAISRQFADALAILPDAELIAVGSRNIDSAKDFAENYNVPFQSLYKFFVPQKIFNLLLY